jgi:hypothetical protein
VQRLSRFHKPFAAGMLMLLDKEEFDRLGGFDEKALFIVTSGSSAVDKSGTHLD